jgi:hypothetical protein
MKLGDLAHTRSGDKGDISNIAVFAYHEADYIFLAEQVTADRVATHLATVVRGRVERHALPGLAALNFVLHAALGGGRHALPGTGCAWKIALLRPARHGAAGEAGAAAVVMRAGFQGGHDRGV